MRTFKQRLLCRCRSVLMSCCLATTNNKRTHTSHAFNTNLCLSLLL